jgi:glycosyltransferase involved in cell wall biosynthesis
MRCPNLSELPPPPAGRAGWPWTDESPRPAGAALNSRGWPQVSIVTPSYNQGEVLEETIRSVLLQGYPDLEYVVIDGGSTDESVDIIRQYSPWISWWISERDRGQTDALNKGFARSHGDIVTWLNSDDLYVPGAVGRAVDACLSHPRAGLVYGDCDLIDRQGQIRKRITPLPFHRADVLRVAPPITQPASFMRRFAWRRAGPLRTDYEYCMDIDLFVSIAERFDMIYVPDVWARFRLHDTSKTSRGPDPFTREVVRITREHHQRLRLLRLALERPHAYVTPSMLVFLIARMLPLVWMDRINRARGIGTAAG